MQLKTLLPGIACAAVLAACAAGPETKSVAKVAPSIGAALAEADVALSAGQGEKAVQLLQKAGQTYPADKQPWMKLAQYQFDTHAYGPAVVSAQEVLARDQDELQAQSIIAVASLRMSLQALSHLAQKNNLKGDVRSEARDLAKLLRDRLGEDVVPKPKALPRAVPVNKTPGIVGTPNRSNDVFGPFR